jgi:hypothetical protein
MGEKKMPSFKSIALASIVLLVLSALLAVAQAACQVGCTCGDPNCNCGETGQCESGAMSGSGPANGGCYADPMTGEITCVDTQGSPVGSTGGDTGGTIIVTTSGGSSDGYTSEGFQPIGTGNPVGSTGGHYPGQQSNPYGGSYVPPITVQRPFTTTQGPSLYENTQIEPAVHTVLQIGAGTAGAYGGGVAAATFGVAAGTAAGLEAVAAGVAVLTLDAFYEGAKLGLAKYEAYKAEEAASKIHDRRGGSFTGE